MTESIVYWPAKKLRPARITVTQRPVSRGGGMSLGGVERTTRTDRGHWEIGYSNVNLSSPLQRRLWNATRTQVAGRAGLIAVPVWSFDSTPYISGERERPTLTPHDDDTLFDDDTPYWSDAVNIEMAVMAALSDTTVTLRLVNASTAVGIRFSYQHAMYETGPILSSPGENLYEVPVFPRIRAEIPADATLMVDMPTCLCHLMTDDGMDAPLGNNEIDSTDVRFVEATDYWNDLALA